ncbi:DNA-binding protein [Brachybacterium endophyticum]|uniref:DNA-binding protein n=1 Tax=Brachybacterium endophyticum TaxID=2182385 RepID=A0A2U2RJH7_9MICO|nr:Rv2175c family DNA-binding protein [Brachybacterium endophyticum]PWH05934.1 DNA-binding protein [Brachybacterium endophyticum]
MSASHHDPRGTQPARPETDGPTTSEEPPLDDLVGAWLTLPDAAEELGVEVSAVRRMVDEGDLVQIRRGTPKVRCVPAELILEGRPTPYISGTLTVLRDAGFTEEELLRWLFTPDDSLPGRPIDELRAGRRGEVRRRAQALAV